MKKIQLKLWVLLSILMTAVSVVLFNSCTPKSCVPPPDGYINLSLAAKEKIPYRSYAQIIFVDSISKDTHTFNSFAWDSSYYYFKEQSEECRAGIYYEQKRLNFQCESFPYPLRVWLWFPNQGGEYIHVGMSKYDFFLAPSHLKKPFFTYDSLTILNKMYYDIYYFKNEKDPERNTPYGCYYNKEFGIVKLELQEAKLELYKLNNQ